MDLDDEPMSRKDPLTGLFQEVGRRPAASGLEAQVMARIEALPAASASASAQPLIGKWVWWVLAVLAGILVAYALSLPTSALPAAPAITWFTTGMHDVLALIASRWTMGILLCTAGLFLLDNWASAKFNVVSRQ